MGERSQLNSFALIPMCVIQKFVLDTGGIHALFVAGVPKITAIIKTVPQ